MSARKPRRRTKTCNVTLIPESEFRKYLADQGNDPDTIDHLVKRIPSYLGMNHEGEKVWTLAQLRERLLRIQRVEEAKRDIKKALGEEE